MNKVTYNKKKSLSTWPGLPRLSLHSRRTSWLLEIAYKKHYPLCVRMCEVGSSSVGHMRNEKVCAIKTVTYSTERKEGFHSLNHNGSSCLDVLQKLLFLPARPYSGLIFMSILYEITSWSSSLRQIIFLNNSVSSTIYTLIHTFSLHDRTININIQIVYFFLYNDRPMHS
jgi:hypothetical protein